MSTKSDQVLKSCNHSFDALKKMKELREKMSLCDINIKIGDTTIAAHKVVLASCSPYFEFMFTGKVTENGKTDIELKDLCPESVSALMDYVYSGFMVVNDETILNILKTADFLQIISAKEECLRFLQKNISASNCIAIKHLAKQHFFTELENKANSFIRWNFVEVIKTDAFLKFTLSELKKFLSDGGLCLVSSSSKQAVSTWIQYNKDSREEFENDLSTTVDGIATSQHPGGLNLYDPSRQKRIYLFNEHSGNTRSACVDLNNLALYNIPKRPNLDQFSCTLVKDSVYLVDTFEGICCQYDMENEKWTKTEMESAWGFHNRACNVHDKIFLVAGGATKAAYTYDIERNFLSQGPRLIHERNYPGVAFDGNCVYVIGGDCLPTTAERLDVRTKTWKPIAQVQATSPGGRCSAALLGDYIYCAGVDADFFHAYDPRNGVWEWRSSIPNAKNGSNTISAADGTLYAVNNQGIYRYKPGDGWSTISCAMYSNSAMAHPTCLYFVPN